MEIYLNKKEIEECVEKHCEENQLIKGDKKVKIVISWENSQYAFPPNISEILSKCEVKAIVSCKEK